MTDRDTGSEHGSACELSDIVSCLVHAPCDKVSYVDVAFSVKWQVSSSLMPS